jgi:beta-glucosidase
MKRAIVLRRLRSAAALLAGLAAAAPLVRSQATALPPYRDARLSVGQRVGDLLSRMTPEEKFWQLFMIPGDLDDPAQDYSRGIFGLQVTAPHDTAGGSARADAERVNAIQRWFVERTRLGVPIIPFEEAVHGLARAGATVFPAAIALAATWDTALVARVARAIAVETASRGVRQVLSPVVNIARDVRWGRVEETYGEDPLLASLMARAWVAALERHGVIATPKHFVANVGEGGRDSYPIEVSERALREVYFPPFKAAVRDAGARSVMTAYNSVDGSPATQNRDLLNGTLKGDWGFGGFVVSDAAATSGATVLHRTEASTATAARHAIESGLDVVFQSSYPQHRPYLDAMLGGTIADSVIDGAVRRVLRAKFELGLFERPYVNPDSAARWNRSAEHRALALDAARASIVLLKNAGHALPLAPTLRAVAVIGAEAAAPRVGGYSAPGSRPVSILDGVRARLGSSASVHYAPGPGRVTREYAAVPAAFLPDLTGRYFDNITLDGAPVLTRTDPGIDFSWAFSAPARGLPFGWYSVRWDAALTAPATGVRRLGVEGNDGYRLWLDGTLLVDNWRKRSAGATLVPVALEPGSRHDLRLEYFENTGSARVRLVWDTGATPDWRAQIDSAVAIARASDVAIIAAGIEEGEFRDRAMLGLPGHQEELIERVAATGKPVVVVLSGGSAITMSRWIDHVSGVLDAWYPGEEGGRAVSDVLFGDYDPAGRLPITFPVAEGQLPLYYDHKPTGRGDDYDDLTGQPLFPFGYGLSYTTFSYSSLAIEPAAIDAGGRATVRCTIRNDGDRAGDEVVQLYLHQELASVARPVMELRGFQRVHLAAGERREITFSLGRADLEMLDRDLRPVVEPGMFRVMVGASSKDIRLRGELVVR